MNTMIEPKGKPIVTIGIPFYNAEESLIEAIRSVFAQTFKQWELLLVDDGSTDKSLDIARRVRDRRVRVLSDGQNRHLSYRLNQIACETRTPLLARMDADDLMHPSRIAEQVNFMLSFPDTDVLGTSAYLTNSSGKIIGALRKKSLRQHIARQFIDNYFIHPTVMMRTDWARQNPYDSQYYRGEDAELWIRSYSRSNFANLAESLYYYRMESISCIKKRSESRKTEKKIIRDYGPETVGLTLTSLFLMRSTIKAMLFSGLRCLNIYEKLWTRRHAGISQTEMHLAESALGCVKATSVPGLDSLISSS